MRDSAFGHSPSYRQKTEAEAAWKDERKTLELWLLRRDWAQCEFSVREIQIKAKGPESPLSFR